MAVPDTSTSPNGGTTTASRQTVFNGEAARLAGLDLKRDLDQEPIQALEGREYYREYSGVTDPFGSDKPNPVSHVAYSVRHPGGAPGCGRQGWSGWWPPTTWAGPSTPPAWRPRSKAAWSWGWATPSPRTIPLKDGEPTGQVRHPGPVPGHPGAADGVPSW